MTTALAKELPKQLPPLPPPHARSSRGILHALGADAERGLSDAQVELLRAEHGPNQLAELPPVPAWKKLLEQFHELVIWLLLAAALVAAFTGEWADAAAILAIVILNALLGFFQQRKAERALAALRKLSAPLVKVVRDGKAQVLPAHELVPGDRIELEAGDAVPADARLLKGFGFQTQEAALTGESLPVGKDPGIVLEEDAPLGDRRNMTYLGTAVAAGKASALVVATGMNTELGRIAGMLQGPAPRPTPLQVRLAQLGRFLVYLCLALVGAVALLELARGVPPAEVFRLAVSLAVAAVPEGLPAVVTIALALGVQRMAKRQALIRKLASVETLGSVTVICTDKTGTLTRNEMTVREVYTGGTRYEVTGVGYASHGEFLTERQPRAPRAEVAALRSLYGLGRSALHESASPVTEPDLSQALLIGVRCNHARVGPTADGSWQAVGDPTEAALLVVARKGGVEAGTGDGHHVLCEIPFDSARKAMSVVVREPSGAVMMYTKGAPEVVLGKCATLRRDGQTVPLTSADRAAVVQAGAEMAGRALRVLAVAYRPCSAAGDDWTQEEGLVFAGLIGMMDPPREEVKAAVSKCHEAGIRPVMITGDHPETALAVARELHLTDGSGRVVTGRELDAMSDEELARQVEHVAVYARVSAEHKLRVVRAWQSCGHVVAMTGDGVNDSPAVKQADIGVAMGVTGTDVTKEASAMVLLDDNFATIVNAVEEGRGIYANVQKFVHYLLAGNAGKLLFVFAAALLGWPVPLLAVQILWLNLVTDGLPALALGVEPAERGAMRRKPRRPGEPLLGWGRALLIVAHGALTAAAALVGFHLVYQGQESNLEEARVVAFCVLGFAQVFYALACRSLTVTVAGLGLFTNRPLLLAAAASAALQLAVVTLPFLHPVFGVEAYPAAWEWGLIAALALLPAAAVELTKLIYARVAVGLKEGGTEVNRDLEGGGRE